MLSAKGSKNSKVLSNWPVEDDLRAVSNPEGNTASGKFSRRIFPKSKKRGEPPAPLFRFHFPSGRGTYIMPPMPGSPAGAGGSGSGMSVTKASVVRIMEAIEQAFSIALRVTLAGSIMPALSMST